MLNLNSDNRKLHNLIESLLFALSLILTFSGVWLLTVIVASTVVLGLLPAISAYVSKLTLDSIIKVVQTKGEFAACSILMKSMLMQFSLLIGEAILSQINNYVTNVMGRRLSFHTNAQILHKVTKIDYAYFENSAFYDLITRAQNGASNRPPGIVLKLISISRNIITFISMGSVVLTLSLPLFMAMTLICLPLLFIEIKYGQKKYALEYSRTLDMRLAGYISSLIMGRRYLPEILSFGLSEYLFKRWYTASEKVYRQDLGFQRKQNLAQWFGGILLTSSNVPAMGYIIFLVIKKGLSVGDIMMYSRLFTSGLNSFRGFLSGISGIYEDTLFLHDLREFSKIEPYIETEQIKRPVPGNVESIELHNVSFKYPGSDIYALRNVNIMFSKSVSTLIVGQNGAGKSTLIKLLMRLYDPSEGQILLNGTDIREFDQRSIRETIGIMFQEFLPLAFSVNENIKCGNIRDQDSNAKIIAAVRQARADSFIDRLPQKYDTLLSRLFENGCELSLGQWQRICLARLFMKDSPVFIFDEPTASLDIETEAHLLHEISGFSKRKICIYISHRMFRPGIAEQIIVLEKGSVVECGSYEELLRTKGKFAGLCKLYHSMSDVQSGYEDEYFQETLNGIS